jgi:DNA-binding NtrC family response regulator
MSRGNDRIVDLGLDDDTSLVGGKDAPARDVVEDVALVVMSPVFTATYRLPAQGEVMIGRAKTCEIHIDDHSVSRQHAIVTMSPFAVRDLGSSNGTRVGGAVLPPDEPHPLRVGDAITIGAATLLVQPAGVGIKPRRFWSGDDFEARIEEECARGSRSEAAFAIAFLKVDRLALDVGVRQVLAQRLRGSDVVGEYGPAEYAILLTDAHQVQADGVMTRIVADLSAKSISARWGVAEFPRDATAAHRLISVAQVAAQDPPPPPSTAPAPGPRPVLADPRMRETWEFVKMIAAGELSVLILGETGVGKEVISEEVHRLSARAAGPFVRLNCAALSEQLLESELFGHEKGAFTSAEKAKAGLLETAAAGTVFLDEIGELPMRLQVKLLRVLEDKQVLRVGGLKPRQLDVRFIAATNRDLEQQAARGLFREDLYYRLAGATVSIPPLRERVEDILPLASMFLRNAAAHLGGRVLELDAGAREALRAHAWPGNIRELRNAIERAALICGRGPITVTHLPPSVTARAPAAPASLLRGRISETERPAGAVDVEADRIVEVLNACGGNQSRAAKELGISRAALIRRLEKIGVIRPRKGS